MSAVELFIKVAITILNLVVSVHPELKDNPIVADILAAVAALHLSASAPK